MYRLSEKDINRIIVACKHYAYHETGSDWMHDEYMKIVGKLCDYLDQNFDNETSKPLECFIPNETHYGGTH